LTVTQIQALVDAALAVLRSGFDPRPELLVPMVSTPEEVDFVRGLLADVRAHVGTAAADLSIAVGAMVETPRAALLAGRLAERVDALSLGTNDLTALLWGLSRDDADRQLLPAYRDLGVVEHSPFGRLDLDGVGAVIRQVVRDARAVRPASGSVFVASRRRRLRRCGSSPRPGSTTSRARRPRFRWHGWPRRSSGCRPIHGRTWRPSGE
jgi:pyruvate,orthophosphate dikinase